jgi:DNA-binding SARP family transcriptional activator/WD40 repeat protein
MQFHVLGPLEVLDAGRTIALGGSKQRALLALFVLHANETLTTDRLIDGLWGERPPATAAKTLQMHVSRLRKTLADGAGNGTVGDGPVVTRERGYQLRLDPERLDSQRFERLVGEGRRELAAGRPGRAATALAEALSLWRGPPLADLAYEPFAQREIARLEDLRVAALEQLIEAKLALGRHAELVGQLETLIAEHPYRERLRVQLMLALYRCDRQAEALQAYQDARRTLVEELGIEPGERLRELERAILAQDPSLAAPALGPVQVPPELDTATQLAGREAELGRVREQWRCARSGAGGLVLVVGARGMGKTRLAAELAAEVSRDRGGVLYASCAGPPAPALRVLGEAREAGGPTLVVLDDVDLAGHELRAAVSDPVDGLAALPVLVLATAEDPALAPALGAGATVILAPLDVDAVRLVARSYAGARDDAEIPAERLAAASGGVPRQVHRAAGEWARGEAARRLGAAVDRAASERTGLRAAEDDLAGDVVELQALRERAQPEGAGGGFVSCPFKGLASFEVEDAEVFFGRERLVAEMVARLAGAPLMGIVGSSGSGKSSALRAGLLATLAAGVLPGSEGWALALLRPGEHPWRALERATAAAGQQGTLVVAVDQFEEVFTSCHDESERAAFVEALVAATRDPRRRALVLVAVRADFYGRCAVFPELSRLLGANHVLVGPMRRDELRRVIEQPARRAGLRVDSDLVDALIADVEGEPGGLPLLSTSLIELWQRRDGPRLRVGAYEEAGGLHGAVARLAESAYARLEPTQRDVARRMLLRLAGEGEGESVVRRRVELAELGADRDDAVGEVLAALTNDRLVTIGDGEVEVAHEALLREWPRLRGWLEDDAEGRRLHHHLAIAAREWDAGGRDPGELYRGARLASTLDWRAEHAADLNALERTFLEESRAQSERDARRARRTNRRLRSLLAAAAALLALAAIAGALFLDQRGHARSEARTAQAQRLGAQALVEDDLDRSLLLARQGVELEDSVETRGNLLAALTRSPAAIGVVRSQGNRLFELALRPDGRALVVGDNHDNILFLDPLTLRRLRPPYRSPRTGDPDLPWQGFAIRDLAFSPDGSRLAIRKAGGVTLLDGRTWRPIATVAVPDVEYSNDVPDATYPHMAFSPDGRTLRVPYELTVEGEVPTTILRIDARVGRRLGRPTQILPGASTADFLTFSPDGGRLVMVENGGIVIRDATTLEPLRRVPEAGGRLDPELAQAFALSLDGRTLAAGSQDGSVRFLDMTTGEWRTASGRHQAAVQRAAFTPDGRFLVTVGDDANAIVWDVAAGSADETLEGHAGRVLALALDRRAHTLFTASLDGNVIAWDLVGDRRLGRPFNAGTGTDVFPATALSRDGRTLVTAQDDGAVSVVDTATLTRRRVPVAGSPSEAHGPAFGPRGTIVVGGFSGFLAVIDARTGRQVARLRGHDENEVVFTSTTSADGSIIATTGTDVTLRLWDVRRARQLGAPIRLESPPLSDAGISPDGRTVAVSLFDGTVNVFAVRSHRRIARVRVDDSIPMFSRFSRDGRLLLTGSRDGRVRVFSAGDWRPLGPAFDAHAGFVSSVDASPDGRTLVTAGTDGQVRLWDVATRRPIGSALPGPENVNAVALFAPDGRHVFAVFANGRGYRWDARPSSWARHACDVAARRLSRAEWEDALGGREYAPAC